MKSSGSTPVYDVYDVPVGTRITMKIEFQRNGGQGGLGNAMVYQEKTIY